MTDIETIEKKIYSNDTIEFNQSNKFWERARLNKLLDEAVKYPLVLVCAGAGYGKTRAVHSFLRDYDAYTTWIQLSQADNVATHFWENYVGVTSKYAPETGERLMQIGFPETDEAFAKYAWELRDVGNHPGKYIVVFDDFHLLNNQAVLRYLNRALKIISHNTKVIIITRTIPEMNLISMMMGDRVFTINEDALRFTGDEIAEYFDHLGLHISKEDAQNVYNDTNGWAFAVNLTGRSLCKSGKYERHALDAMKTNIFNLIESEIHQTVSERLWRFLLRISLIQYLAASLIKKLAEDESLIKEMELLSAFIRYDLSMDAYIIHNLFLDYLWQKNDCLTKEEKRDTYEKAGSWCEENNYQTDALAYYEKAENWDAVMRVAYAFNIAVPRDMARYVLEIFDRIPKDIQLQNPKFPNIMSRMKTSVGLIDEAYNLTKEYIAEYEAMDKTPEIIEALSRLYGTFATLKFVTCSYKNEYDFDLDFKKQYEYFEKNPYTVVGPSTNFPVGTFAVLCGESRAGAPDEYVEALSRSVPYLSRVMGGNYYGMDDLALGELCYFQNKMNKAKQYFQLALTKAREKKQYDIEMRSLLYSMCISFFYGDLAEVDAALKDMKALLEEKEYTIRQTMYDIGYGYYNIYLGQSEKIPDWLKGDFAQYDNPALFENYANLCKMNYHYATQKYNVLLAFIESEREKMTLLFGKIQMRILEALSLYQLKQRDKAVLALNAAYELASPNNLTMPFIQIGKDMRTLTAAASKNSLCRIPNEWLMEINRKSSTYAKRIAHLISEYKIANNIDNGISLTRRETTVLHDLSHGLSRSEIAASQNISVNTVKMVINNIYEKLNANCLADVIRIAAEHKLI